MRTAAATPTTVSNLENALESFRAAVREVRPFFMQSPEIADAVGKDLDLIDRQLDAITTLRPHYIADRLAALRSLLVRAGLPDPSADADSPSHALTTAQRHLEVLRSASDRVLAAAAAAGHVPLRAAAPVESGDGGASILPRASLRDSWRGALLTRLSAVDSSLDAVTTAARGPGSLPDFERRMVRYLAGTTESDAELVRFELSVAKVTDLASITFAADSMEDTALDFIATIAEQHAPSVARLQAPARTLGQATGRLRRGSAALDAGHRRLHQRAVRQSTAASRPVLPQPELSTRVAECIARGEPIATSDAQSITHLNLRFRGLRDISALSGLTHLHWLSLAMNSLDDLTPLSGLRELRHIDLAITNVADVRPLGGLTQLEHLDLSGTWVQRLKPLVTLKKLKSLSLGRNRITDIAPLVHLSELCDLDLRETPLINIAALASLSKLRRLVLRGTRVRSLSPLAKLDGLEHLDVRHTPISDLLALSRLTSLTHLDLMGTNVSDLAPLAACHKLRSLKVGGAPLRRAVAALVLPVLQETDVPKAWLAATSEAR
jgi:hypothetical protein